MQHEIDTIIQKYAQGYFLMADESNRLEWHIISERTLIPLDERFHIPRSLRRVLKSERFTVTINRDFKAVVDGCGNRQTTWISSELKKIYCLLNQAGYAHSVEVWQGDELAGGLLGIAIGGAFIGESMFHRVSNASKVGLVHLVERLRQRQFLLQDGQWMKPHLKEFGAYQVSGEEFQALLNNAVQRPCCLL